MPMVVREVAAGVLRHDASRFADGPASSKDVYGCCAEPEVTQHLGPIEQAAQEGRSVDVSGHNQRIARIHV
jgi:hypothetical protein